MATPKLRFKEFEFDLINYKLIELTIWSSGGTPSKSNCLYWGGEIPLISAVSMHKERIIDSDVRITDLGLKNGSRIAPENSVLILVRGSMLFKKIPIGIALRDVAFNQDVKCITPKSKLNSNFLFQWTLSKENIILNKVSYTGIGAGKLETSDLQNLRIKLPELKEQTKIANFLSAVDEKINQLSQKIELLTQYKQGMMQKLFSQNIRFKADDGSELAEWKEIKLGDIAIKKSSKNKENLISEVLTNSATKGIIKQGDYFEREIVTDSNLIGYYIVNLNDFVYNPRISVHAPVGPINRNKKCVGIMSPLYTVFTFKQGNLDFLEYLFESDVWHDYIKSVANSGARHDRMNITSKDFFEIPIMFPSLQEQTKIANFLSSIDQKNDLTEQQLQQAKQWKKGLLQQMFV